MNIELAREVFATVSDLAMCAFILTTIWLLRDHGERIDDLEKRR